MNVLCIGPGQSALEYQDYAQFNNFDYKIGCRELLSDPAWLPLDYITVALGNDYKFIHTNYPDQVDKVVTIPRIDRNKTHGVKFNVMENTWSVQIRLAIHLGATHITTIGYDVLTGDIRTLEDREYRKHSPVQTHIIDKTMVNDRAKILNSILRLALRLTRIEDIPVTHKLERVPIINLDYYK